MKRSQYWSVKQTHARTAYNDEDEYSIVNGEGKTIASFYNGSREKLAQVVDAHNLCFLADAQAGEVAECKN